MFTLQIHTIDFRQHLHTTVPFATINGDHDVKPAELMCMAHLFRQLSMTSPVAVLSTVANVSIRTTLVFVVAAPNYMSADDFLIFCGPHLSSFIDILFLRNEGMEDRYSVFRWLENQLAADGFYCSFNGKRFKPSEGDWIQMLVEYRASCVTIHFNVLVLRSGPTCLARWKKGEWDQ